MSETYRIEYRFTLDDGTLVEMELSADLPALQLSLPEGQENPEWTKLTYHQCDNCPLKEEDSPFCPTAERLVEFQRKLAPVASTEKVHVEVLTEERSFIKDTTAERGKQSLVGLIMALSGCPHMDFFKPLARFHLPFATLDETMFRVTSSYLLLHYFQTGENQPMDQVIDDLDAAYQEIHKVNLGLAERLRASNQFFELNALTNLDSFTQIFPDALEDIEYIFPKNKPE